MRTRPRALSAAVLLLIAAGFAFAPTGSPRAMALVSTQPPPMALGVNIAGAPDNASQLDAWQAMIGRRPAAVMWYQGWDGPLYYQNQMTAVLARGETPVITWLPESSSRSITLRSIAAGAQDAYIASAARQARAAPTTIYIRFAHEMNGNWSPWGQGVNGNTSSDFIAAWRHVVGVFRAIGASNVRFIWSPNIDYGHYPFVNLYPGDAWVDIVGLDGYNWGSIPGNRWRSLLSLFQSSYNTLTALTSKPFIISETASTEVGGGKAQWILDGLLRDIPSAMPRTRAVIWFDRNKETDWRTNSSPSALAAFKTVANSPLYSASFGTALGLTPAS